MSRKRFPTVNVREEKPRQEAIRELFEINKRELPMKTNTPAFKIEPFVLMETVQEGLAIRNIKNKSNGNSVVVGAKPVPRRLSEIYLEKHDIRMIGRSGRGRMEAERILSSGSRSSYMDDIANEMSI